MNTLLKTTLAGALLLSAGAAFAAASVTYTDPDKFTDVPFSQVERERVLKDLSAHFAKLASTLPAGQDLKVEVLDVDLAGRIRHDLRATPELRVLTGGADWPHIHLRYSVEQNGQVLKSGDEQLSNMTYLDRQGRYTGSDTLRYEKQMLDDWFRQKVAAR